MIELLNLSEEKTILKLLQMKKKPTADLKKI